MNPAPRPLSTKALWDAPLAWRGRPHLPRTLQGELPRRLPQSWPTWDCLISLWKRQSWQALSSLILRAGEVEQASVERLNNCINMASSRRTHAYTAASNGWELHCKAASCLLISRPNFLYTRLRFSLHPKEPFINQARNKKCLLHTSSRQTSPIFAPHTGVDVCSSASDSNDFLV